MGLKEIFGVRPIQRQEVRVGKFTPCDDCEIFPEGGWIPVDESVPEGYIVASDGECAEHSACSCRRSGYRIKDIKCIVPIDADIPPVIKVK